MGVGVLSLPWQLTRAVAQDLASQELVRCCRWFFCLLKFSESWAWVRLWLWKGH